MIDVYLMGSLRNPAIRNVAGFLRKQGWTVFDDWHAAGPKADDHWQDYEKNRGNSYLEALENPHATMVFDFDVKYLFDARSAVMVLPAGRSAFLELGWMAGKGRPCFVLMDKEFDRWDIMLKFVTKIVTSSVELQQELELNLNVPTL